MKRLSAKDDTSTATTNVNITSGSITGISDLAVADGGTGASTLTGILKGNGTSAFTAVTAPSGAIVGTTDTQTLTDKTISTGSVIDTNVTVTEVLKKVYPVGCIYFSTNSTNPATSLGFGTWSAFGAGRVPVGFDSGQTEFDADEETGGAKTVTLSTTEMPSHSHTQDSHNHTQNSHVHSQNVNSTAGGTPVRLGGSASAAQVSIDTGSATATNQATTATNQNTGGGGAHNNLQPYIVVRMYKRTA